MKKYPIFRRILAGIILILAGYGFQRLASASSEFSSFYTRNIYSVFVNVIGRISGILPFSLVEILLYALLISIGVSVLLIPVRIIARFFRKQKRPFYPLADVLSGIWLLVGILFLEYVLFCGINYQSPSFSETEGFVRQADTPEELKDVTLWLIEQLNEDTGYISFDENGEVILPDNCREEAVRCMEKLGEKYSSLSGYYPSPKAVWNSTLLSERQLTGVYSPFTIEANYNADVPRIELVYTMCHELSHLRGFMREDEANFIAWLACTNSDVPEIRYAANLMAFMHCISAYSSAAGSEAASEVYQQLNENARAEYQAYYVWWKQWEGEKAEAETKLNDAYLKANNQTDGVKSYGRVVDLIVACWREMQ